MLYLLIKAGVSGVLVAIVSEVAKRYPGVGGLIASLPLVSVLGMIWLWRDTGDTGRLAAHSTATFWFVLPSLPMFLVIPVMLRRGAGFWPASFFQDLKRSMQSLWMIAASETSVSMAPINTPASSENGTGTPR